MMDSVKQHRVTQFMRYMRESDGWFPLVFVSGVSTGATFSLMKALYALAADQYAPLMTERIKFAFSFPIHYWLIIVCLATGMVILETKRWMAVSAFGFFCYCVAMPVYATSGPISQVLPLLELRVNLVLVAYPINVCLLILWNAAARRANTSVPSGNDVRMGMFAPPSKDLNLP